MRSEAIKLPAYSFVTRHFLAGGRRWAAIRGCFRADEFWFLGLSSCVGLLAGAVVSIMTQATLLTHRLLFTPGGSGRLSGLEHLDTLRCLVPALGGLVFGLLGVVLATRMRARPIDPIEANALRGGRMSLRDSMFVALQTVVSNGFGASLGLEAGFTQAASALGSWLARLLRLPRAQVRLLVGCGAAGAIGAAFNAPLAGAFYAFELVIGAYTLATLVPVSCAALCATGLAWLTDSVAPEIGLIAPSSLNGQDFIAITVLAGLSSMAGIALMRGVTLFERGFQRSHLPLWSRPALGGLAVGGLAMVSPSVLSSGHMAMRLGLMSPPGLGRALGLMGLKALASAVSIGAGFRGGLFFASLYLGVLGGAAYGDLLHQLGVSAVPVVVCTVAGMCAFAVAVIGGPMTMIFLALETTGSFPLTVAVLVAALVSSLVTRRSFGYSFATWRFHLRGETIRSPVDVGRVRGLLVEKMMRDEVMTLPSTASVGQARAEFPGLSPRYLVLVDAAGGYDGILLAAALHDDHVPADDLVCSLGQDRETTLLPQTTVRDALAIFDHTRSPALVVVADDSTRRVIGLLTERHVLRRYAEELERTWRDLAGAA